MAQVHQQLQPGLFNVLTDDLLRPLLSRFQPIEDFLLRLQHPYSRDLPFISTKYFVSIILVFALLYVWGKLVINKKMHIKYFLIAQHAVLACTSIYVAIEVAKEALSIKNSVWCNSVSVDSKKMANLFWIFYVSKVLELFNLLARVLQGKVVSLIPSLFFITNLFFAYAAVFHIPSGEAYFPILINTVVSAFIYTSLLAFSVGNGFELLPLDYWVISSLQNLINIVHTLYLATSSSCNIQEIYIYSFMGYNIIALLYQYFAHKDDHDDYVVEGVVVDNNNIVVKQQPTTSTTNTKLIKKNQ